VLLATCKKSSFRQVSPFTDSALHHKPGQGD
jgi:hypothetical protein